jgi:N-acetylneuraminic acid mutarotase
MNRNSEFNKSIIFIILFSLICSFILAATSAVADTDSEITYKVDTREDVLPYPYSRGSAVYLPEVASIYIFGGRNETDMLDRIMKYTPSTDQLEILDTRLPTVLMGSTAVYADNYVYIFGGKDYDDFHTSILRFDPKNESIMNMTAHLPKPTVGAAAVFDGEHIYFFGGSWGGIEPQKFDSILRYDPDRDNITIMNSKLTFGRSGLAATFDGENIYVLGGSDGKQYSDEVFVYYPSNDTLIALPGKLPTGRNHIQAEYHDGAIYVFGGRGSPTLIYDQIVRYDIQDHNAEILNEKLPRASEFRMHAYDGENIYIIGGFSAPKDFNQFTVFSMTQQKPTSTNSGAYCPPDDPWITLIIISVILIFVVIIRLTRDYWKKK